MGFALSDIHLGSTAFGLGDPIPEKYSGEGEDVSPELTWSNTPKDSLSYAVICHDPDAPLITRNGNYGFVHWVYYNIPASVNHITEACEEYTCGITDFGKQVYGGPMPPEGHGQHNYYFWILALNKESDFPPGLTMYEFLEAAEPNIIGMNRLIGNYRR
ncbi:MAG: Raf kinase inhibitor-like YbhB/YbcL family protein [Gammaproteobacteria bacterium]|jgi:Raf kinase inhibitor-like YbhB/YbcL family protein